MKYFLLLTMFVFSCAKSGGGSDAAPTATAPEVEEIFTQHTYTVRIDGTPGVQYFLNITKDFGGPEIQYQYPLTSLAPDGFEQSVYSYNVKVQVTPQTAGNVVLTVYRDGVMIEQRQFNNTGSYYFTGMEY